MLGSNERPTPDIVADFPVEMVNLVNKTTQGFEHTLTMTDHVFLELQVREHISRQEIPAAEAKAEVDR